MDIARHILEMAKDEFAAAFMPLAREPVFSTVASGAGTLEDIYLLGCRLNQTGLPYILPSDIDTVQQAAHAITAKIHRDFHRQ